MLIIIRGRSASLTPFLMDLPMHADRISIELPILCNKGSQVEISKLPTVELQ